MKRSGPRGDMEATPTQLAFVYGSIGMHRPWANLEQVEVHLDEAVGLGALRAAWVRVVATHDALRFVWRDGAWLEADGPFEISIEHHDWSTLSEPQQEKHLRAYLEEDRRRGVDLAQALPWRVMLARLGPRGSVLVWTVHHALVDARGMGVVLEDLLDELAGRARREPSASFRQYLDGLRLRRSEATRRFFAGELAELELTARLYDCPAPLASRTRRATFRLDEATTSALRASAASVSASLANVIQAAWALLLARVTGRDDVVFGVVVSDRYAPRDAQRTVGCLINTLPLRLRVSEDLTLGAWLSVARRTTLAMRPHHHASLSDLREWLELPGDRPMFESTLMFDFESFSSILARGEGAWQPRRVTLHEEGAEPLAVAAYGDARLLVRFEHDPAVVDDARAEALLESFRRLLSSIARAEPDTPLAALDMLSESERARLLELGRPEHPVEVVEPCLAMRFERVARERQDAVAVCRLADDARLRFGELDARANGLAWLLSERGVGEGDVVALHLERSREWVVAMLATWKVGAAFIPVDPGYPEAVVEHILRDSGARLVVTRQPSRFASSVSPDAPPRSDAPRRPPPDPSRLAYVIYTSGSTGTPKGVMVSCGSLVAHADAVTIAYRLDERDRVLQFASPSFDVALEEVVPTLLAGGRLALRDGDGISTTQLLEAARQHELTVLNLPATYLHVLVDDMVRTGSRMPPSVRLLVTGSERVDPRALAKLARLEPSLRWINGYGPTECTITSTCHEAAAVEEGRDVPIGRPLGHARAYVLAADGSLAPLGAPGVLWIGGPAVALGYVGQPELTARVFRASPFEQGRIYRTGDRARWRPSGELDFLDRTDREVKVRGHRVDLRHVERALESMEEIERAVVAVDGAGTSAARLVAWVQVDRGPVDPVALRRAAEARLPPPMVPTLSVVESFPLGPRGKIDVAALRQVAPRGDDDTPPRASDARTMRVAEVMAKTLGKARIGPDDSFYDVGGHSLLALRLVGALSSELGVELDVVDVHRLKTPRAIAHGLDGGGGSGPRCLLDIQPHGSKPPLFGVHVLGLNDLYFRPLSRRLGDDHPVFGLTVGRLDTSTPSGVEAVASLYREAIEARFPDGPVCLAAVSLGAYYAYELAQQLIATGRDVRVLALFDAGGPAGRPMVPPHLKLLHHLVALRERGPRHLAEQLDRALDEVRHRRQRMAVRVQRRLGFVPPSTLAAYVAANELAVESYRPQPYPGRLTIFRSLEATTDAEDVVMRGLGWAEVAVGGFEVLEVPGGHLTMLAEPHVEHVADALRRRIHPHPH